LFTRSFDFKMTDNDDVACEHDGESRMLDIEKGKILASLEKTLSLASLNNGAIGNGHQLGFKWAFVAAIILLGTIAGAAVLVIGISGAHRDSEQAFLREASHLASVMEFSWKGYETLALWIHESCQFNIVTDSEYTPQDHLYGNGTISQERGFCSRAKFKHIYQHIRSVEPKFIAVQFAPNVTHSLRKRLEDESRLFLEESNPDFNYSGVRDYLAYPNATFKAIVQSPQRPFYFPIHYMEPVERNEAALDFDMYSYRTTEIDTAMATQKPVLGPRGKLLQDDRPDVYAVDLIHPGYSSSAQGEHIASSDAVSKIVIRFPDLIERAVLATGYSSNYVIYIYDETPKRTAVNGGKPVFLAAAEILNQTGSSAGIALKREIPMEDIPTTELSYSTTIQASDHTLRVIIQGEEAEPDIVFVVLGGVIIMLACFFVAFAFCAHFTRTAKMHQIKSDTEEEKAQLALLQAKRETHLNEFIAHEVR
jgi:CHASE domain